MEERIRKSPILIGKEIDPVLIYLLDKQEERKTELKGMCSVCGAEIKTNKHNLTTIKYCTKTCRLIAQHFRFVEKRRKKREQAFEDYKREKEREENFLDYF